MRPWILAAVALTAAALASPARAWDNREQPRTELASLGVLSALGSVAALSEQSLKQARRLSEADGGGGGGGGPIDERRPLNANGHLRISNLAGSVDIATWDRAELRISGRLGGGVDKLDIGGDPDNVSVTVKLPKKSHGDGEADLRLLVPVNVSVEVDAVSADVAAQGLRGPFKVSTVSGDIRLQLSSPDVSVQTVSGDLILRAPARDTRVNSVSGDLHMAGLQDRLDAETVSGNLDLEGAQFSALRLKSVSGDMHLDVSFAEHARATGETLSGQISVLLPADASGTALLKSFSGETQCPDGLQEAVQKGKRRMYRLGDGKGAELELSSFSGDIRVERK
jgi:hypothetical protein